MNILVLEKNFVLDTLKQLGVMFMDSLYKNFQLLTIQTCKYFMVPIEYFFQFFIQMGIPVHMFTFANIPYQKIMITE
jgi:hypothetical protein